MRKMLNIKLLGTAYLPDQLLALQGPIVLFFGRSNAGKSSLLNALTSKDLAKVSKAPGKTRSVNYYQYGNRILLVDLPGYGYAKRSHEEMVGWQKLMEAFFDSLPAGSLSFLLMDAKRDLESEEFHILESLMPLSANIQLLLTKSDRLNQSLRQKRTHYVQGMLRERKLENILTWRFVSVKTGEEVEPLRRDLYQYGKEFALQAQADGSKRS